MMEAPATLVKSKDYIGDFRGLEILRFILSLSVIVWHYQHFFYPFIPFEHRELFLTKQPFFEPLQLFYTEGYYAVTIFWFISGMIFYRIYEKRIAENEVGIFSYGINRFSRLYPLHVAMLFLVLFLQYFYFSEHGSYFVYQQNTVKTFFQNLFFVQTWGTNKFSYNGPTWSVSIEILVYLAFFMIAKSGFLRHWKGLVMTVLFFALIKKWTLVFATEDLLDCFYFFFLGCLFIKAYERFKLWAGMWILVIWLSFIMGFLFTLYWKTLPEDIFQRATGRLDVDWLFFTLSVVTGFLCLFRFRTFDRIPNRWFQYFGDMTYSTYLIHFPLQLILFLLLNPSDHTIFFSKYFFIVYIGLVIVLGRLTYRYFELPLQSYLRNKLR